MKKIDAESQRFRLDQKAYRALLRQILKRDNWRCQSCGSMLNPQVHHLQFRSHSGSDLEQNLVTLCAGCHERVHRRQ